MELEKFPAPLVTWKVYADLGGLKKLSGDEAAARAAFGHAAEIINSIEANTNDEALRATFLNSAAVREVLDGAARSAYGTAES